VLGESLVILNAVKKAAAQRQAARYMKLIDLNRDGGIGANSLFVQIGELKSSSTAACTRRSRPRRHTRPGLLRGKIST
jgi:hypothetical protein